MEEMTIVAVIMITKMMEVTTIMIMIMETMEDNLKEELIRDLHQKRQIILVNLFS